MKADAGPTAPSASEQEIVAGRACRVRGLSGAAPSGRLASVEAVSAAGGVGPALEGPAWMGPMVPSWGPATRSGMGTSVQPVLSLKPLCTR